MPPTDTPETFEEKYAEEIKARTSAGLSLADAIQVQKTQVEFDIYWEKEKSKREAEEAKAKKKAAQA